MRTLEQTSPSQDKFILSLIDQNHINTEAQRFAMDNDALCW